MYNRIAGYKQYYKSLVMLGVPIIIGQLGAIITGLADTIMVGQHSTEELAAASFVNNVINAFIIMGTGLTGDLPKPRLFRPTRRTLAIDKTLFRGLISLDPIRNAL